MTYRNRLNWITKKMRTQITEKKLLGHKTFRIPENHELKNEYKQKRNRLISDLRNAEITYIINILTNIKQRILPKTRVKFNKKKHKKSQWMSRGILNSINSKDKLYKKLVKTSPDSPIFANLKTNFNTFKNIIRRSIVEAKKLHYKNTLKNFSNHLRKTWNTINETLNRNKKRKRPQMNFTYRMVVSLLIIK